MRSIANFLWFIFGGLITGLIWFVLGLVWCITIIGIPFGLQCFKMAKLTLSPFGKKVKGNFGSHPIANFIWFIFGGFVLWFVYLIVGLVFCITIVGIPVGLQALKISKLAAFPFGAKVE